MPGRLPGPDDDEGFATVREQLVAEFEHVLPPDDPDLDPATSACCSTGSGRTATDASTAGAAGPRGLPPRLVPRRVGDRRRRPRDPPDGRVRSGVPRAPVAARGRQRRPRRAPAVRDRVGGRLPDRDGRPGQLRDGQVVVRRARPRGRRPHPGAPGGGDRPVQRAARGGACRPDRRATSRSAARGGRHRPGRAARRRGAPDRRAGVAGADDRPPARRVLRRAGTPADQDRDLRLADARALVDLLGTGDTFRERGTEEWQGSTRSASQLPVLDQWKWWAGEAGCCAYGRAAWSWSRRGAGARARTRSPRCCVPSSC